MNKSSLIISIASLCVAAATLVLVYTSNQRAGDGMAPGQAWTSENQRELANKLKISEKALIGLMKSDIPLQLINDITQPLVSLYCSIKFVNGEYKGEENDERQTHTT